MKELQECAYAHRWLSKPHKGLFYACLTCLSLYLSYTLYFAYSPFLKSTAETVVSVLLFLGIAVGLFGVLLAACRFFACRKWTAEPETGRLHPGFFAASFLVAAGVLLVVQQARGGWVGSPDSASQWEQIQTGSYDNWHPVFHTLLVLVAYRVGGSYAMIITLQMLAFAAAFAYFLSAVQACTASRNAHGVSAWILLLVEVVLLGSPLVSDVLCYAWKDNCMSIGVMCMAGYAVQIYRTRGEWLRKPHRLLLVGAAAAFTTLVRHNGFMFTLTWLAVLFLAYRSERRRILAASAAALLLVIVVRGPLYSRLQVTYPDNLLQESIGIPMTILCDVRVLAPEKLPQEARAFLDAFIPEECWTGYTLHNYNTIKWNLTTAPAEHGLTWESIFRMTMDTIAAAPRESFEAVNGTMELVWSLYEPLLPTQWNWNVTGIQFAAQKGVCDLRRVMEMTRLGFFSYNIGPSLAILLVCTLLALYRQGPRTLLLALPILFYDLGTMLLLCGEDGRFFQCSVMIALPLALALFPRRTKKG